jgi:hypothetical protein
MMEAVSTSETSENFYQTTQRKRTQKISSYSPPFEPEISPSGVKVYVTKFLPKTCNFYEDEYLIESKKKKHCDRVKTILHAWQQQQMKHLAAWTYVKLCMTMNYKHAYKFCTTRSFGVLYS